MDSSFINDNMKANRHLPINQSLNEELNTVIRNINAFLKKAFDLSTYNMSTYKQKVKQFFINHSTNKKHSCMMSSLFSKLSNMLQPFLTYQNPSNDHISMTNCFSKQEHRTRDTGNHLKYQLEQYRNKYNRMNKYINSLQQELQTHRTVGNRLTNLIYLLRRNNIDIDLIYERGFPNEYTENDQSELRQCFETELNESTKDKNRCERHKKQMSNLNSINNTGKCITRDYETN